MTWFDTITMGLLRFLLALAVIIGHSSPLFGLRLMHPSVAVQAFYIVSGFYMALILHQRYIGPGSTMLFLTNRALRIFPTYWSCLLLAMAISATLPVSTFTLFADRWAGITGATRAFLVATNALVFGQDATLFLGLDAARGSLYLTPNFWGTTPFVQQFLFVPQAWSLGLELMFYLVAPLLVRRHPVVIVLWIAASLALRITLYRRGLSFDPWTYRFFPNELAMFLLGALGYKLHFSPRFAALPRWAMSVPALLALVVTLALPFDWSPDATSRVWFYYALLVVAVPCLFELTRRSRIDAMIGELSFPMYLLHFAVIWLIQRLALPAIGGGVGTLTAVLTIALSLALYVVVVRPLDRIRARRVGQPAPGAPTLHAAARPVVHSG